MLLAAYHGWYIMNWELITSWIKYPFSETVHCLQGVLTGWLATRAIFHREISDILVAILIATSFISYETLERWRIGDNADIDVMNFWIAAMATGFIYWIIRLYRKYRTGGRFIG